MKNTFFEFPCLLINFNSDFKHVIVSFIDDLLSLLKINEKLEMFNFQHNYNYCNIPHIASNMAQTVHKSLVS